MYAITLKAPMCRKCKSGVSIDKWLHSHIMEKHIWKGELFYNDEKPDIKGASEELGHSKGIVVWNDHEVGWLVHSVPKWPETLLNDIPDSELRYAQSFAWLILPISQFPIIIKQLQIMSVLVYHDPHEVYKRLNNHEQIIHLVKFSDNVYHVAKSKYWVHDFYEEGLAKEFFPNSTWKTETWARNLEPPTEHIKRIKKVHWICDKIPLDDEHKHTKKEQSSNETEFEYTDEQDHSKFAISDKQTNCIFIGDLNAVSTQFHRGGGGFVFKNDSVIYESFDSICSL